mgnify:CR=1 FL=1
MSSRDRRLAETKYAGRKSASESASEKSRGKTQVSEDPMAAMRRAVSAPRSQESIDRAHAHQRGLPPLG